MDKEQDCIYSNKKFEYFLKYNNLLEIEVFAFVKSKLYDDIFEITENFESKKNRIILTAKRYENYIICSVEEIKHSFIEQIRKEIIINFASSVSHIFYNILTIITNHLEKTEEGTHKKILIESVNRITQIVDTMNFYSNNIQGYISPDYFSLNDVLNEAIKRTSPIWEGQAKLKKIEYIIKKEFENDCIIQGNKADFLLAIVHILKNSFEAMSIGGILVIKTFTEVKGYISIEIEDNGIGIDYDNIIKVTEPFFTTKKLKRDGLGLTFAYGVVKKHKGNFKINSFINRGTTVLISIPVNTSKKELIQSTFLESNKKILLIDDERLIVDSTAVILERIFKTKSIKAYSGSQGITLFRNNFTEIDIVICDLGMDDVNGFDVSLFIKKYSEENNIKKPIFILYTGWGNNISEENKKLYYIDYVFNKPLMPKQFETVINDIRNKNN